MDSKSNKPNSPLNRRRFLNLAGLAAAAGFSAVPAMGRNNRGNKNSDITSSEEAMEFLKYENDIAEIIESKVICSQPGRFLGDGSEYGVDDQYHPAIKKRVIEADRYMGWPTLTKTRDGELLVAFSGDRDAHVCPWGITQVIRSRDNGKTWSLPETINNTPLDDRDAGILETRKGTLLVSWFTSVAFTLPVYKTAFERYARYATKITPGLREQWLGNWVRRSEDGGKTWDTPIRTINSAPHGPIQLRDGRLLYIGTGKSGDKPGILVEESTDDGRSWKIIAALPKPEDPTTSLNEPHMVELASGKLLAMIRNEPKDRSKSFLLQSESVDGGKTWSPLRNTGIWGLPPHLLQLKNGWVLVAYGHRRQPLSERACISKDEGKTWDIENQITIASAISVDHGYPSSVQLDDGSILTVFYQAEKTGAPTVVMSTHWRLK